jgi:crotonobetainyl-CoA:carnitine CoA-transferase CaiB-like acyl-CoA transferase
MGACAGLRVLDLSTGYAGPIAAMVLADYGAEVIRIEPAGGDEGWDEPAYLLLQRGKKSIDLDLTTEAGRSELHRLVPGVDLVIETFAPGEAERCGVAYEQLKAINPAIVVCSISGFGRTGPYAHAPADDALVMAKAGIFLDQPGWAMDGARPIFRASRDASHFTAMLAVQGMLAALRVRDLTGLGQQVETSLLASLSCRQNPKVRWLLRETETLPVASGKGGTEVQSEKHVLPHHLDPRQINLIGMMVETKDGRWLVHSHTEPHFFPAWIKTIGLDWIWEDERFRGAPYRLADTDTKMELISIIQERMKTRTAAEWMEAYVANGNVCGDAIQTTQDALRHPQSTEPGWVVSVDDARVGRCIQIGPLAKLPAAPGVVSRGAPSPGQDTAQVLAVGLEPRPAISASCPTPAHPLAGITIVECAYYYAAPFASALLAELGARIIKIEPMKGDPYRLIASAGVGDPVLNLGHNNMVRAMQGKESIQLNLKDPEGREILHKLVANADIFLHSFRKGVPESLGIDETTLRKIKPDLVYQYGASYGSVGPYSRQPAIDPIIAAYAGTTVHQSGAGNPPLTETGADPVAAAGHAAAMMLGLFARHRTGKGQFVESAMIVSNIYHNFEDALSYEGKPERTPVDKGQFGTGATYRLYETAGVAAGAGLDPHANQDPRWVFLAAQRDAQFRAFCEVAGRSELAADPRFATRRARKENDPALTALLKEIFPERTAQDWESALLAAGVGCIRADAMSNFAFLYRDEQARAIELMTKTEHSTLGRYWRHAPLLRFSRTPGRVTTTCEAGEHTRALLSELGYDEEAIARLSASGVVDYWKPAPELKVSA